MAKEDYKERFKHTFKLPKGPVPKYTENEIDYLCSSIIEWSKQKDSFHLAGFSTQFNRTRTWLYSVAEDYPQFSDALNVARANLANKYCFGMMTNELNSSFGEKYFPIFDKEYKELLKWKEDIKRELEDKPQLIPSWEENVEFMNWKAEMLKNRKEFEEFLAWKQSHEK